MARCSYCSEDELLPFTCNYCGGKFCRRHHLPEKHDCTGLTMEKLQAKRQAERERANQRTRSRESDRSRYKKAYEIPGVIEVIDRGRRAMKSRSTPGTRHFDVDEKVIAAGIILLILLLGVISRFL